MELWDLYTKDRQKTNKTMVRGTVQPEDYYRIVVHVCVFSEDGKMLIQQRQSHKKHFADMWELSASGSAASGETSSIAASRELLEEVGIDISFENIRPSLTVDLGGRVFDDFYLAVKNISLSDVKFQHDEVKAVKWASFDEILSMINIGQFVPFRTDLIKLLFTMRDQRGGMLRDACDMR